MRPCLAILIAFAFSSFAQAEEAVSVRVVPPTMDWAVFDENLPALRSFVDDRHMAATTWQFNAWTYMSVEEISRCEDE